MNALYIRHPHTGKIVATTTQTPEPEIWEGRIVGVADPIMVTDPRDWLRGVLHPLTGEVAEASAETVAEEIDIPAYVIDASAVVQLDAHTGSGAGDCVASAEWYPFDAAPGGTWHGLFTAGGAWTAPDIAGALAKIRARYPDAEVVATAEFILK